MEDTTDLSPKRYKSENTSSLLQARIKNLELLLKAPQDIIDYVCGIKLPKGDRNFNPASFSKKGDCNVIILNGKEKQRVNLPRKVLRTPEGLVIVAHNKKLSKEEEENIITWPTELDAHKPWDKDYTLTHVYMLYYKRRKEMEHMLSSLQSADLERCEKGISKYHRSNQYNTVDISHSCNRNSQTDGVCIATEHLHVHDHKVNLDRKNCPSLVEVKCPDCGKWICAPCLHDPLCTAEKKRITQEELVQFYIVHSQSQ